MRQPADAFHLAIPCRDLDEAHSFYVTALGCRPGRRYDDRLSLDFFGDQVVCHLSPERIDAEGGEYPRHFGISFRERAAYDALLERVRAASVPFLRAPFVRFAGQPEEHTAFLVRDPSNNVIEFKHYPDARMMH